MRNQEINKTRVWVNRYMYTLSALPSFVSLTREEGHWSLHLKFELLCYRHGIKSRIFLVAQSKKFPNSIYIVLILGTLIVFYFQADMYIGHHGEKMLESFCKWQHEEFGKKNDIHLEMSTSWGEDMTSVDAAILITR